MTNLPKLLKSNNNAVIHNSDEWVQIRRKELIRLFEENVYGAAPAAERVWFDVENDGGGWMDGKAVRKKIRINYSGINGSSSFQCTLYLPAGREKAPVFVLGYNRRLIELDVDDVFDNPFWPGGKIIGRGFGTAVFCFDTISNDADDGFDNGVHKVLDQNRSESSWGTIAAWSWGYSRVMDYLETDEDIDRRRVYIVGHSRGGKAALWCGALDQRFGMVVSNVSGCTGAALARYRGGESIADINTVFPHWFCDNYKKYNGNENRLPVDQHMLLALIAPNKLYVTSASQDAWANPKAEFMSCVEAASVYRLFDKNAMAGTVMPPLNTPRFGSLIAYHIREGEHGLMEYDWDNIMNYASM